MLTNGVLNGKTLLEGNNLFCFAYQNAVQAQPDAGLALVTKISNELASLSSELSCPQLSKIDHSQFSQFPGYTSLKTGSSGAHY